MSLRKIAMCPPLMCKPADTVAHAVDMMLNRRIGAALVVDGERIVGILTERDVLSRVVGPRLNAEQLTVAQTMTKEVQTFPVDGDFEDAMRLMMRHHFRHLPLVDQNGQPAGMLSIRRILGYHVDSLKGIVASLCAYIGADGPGG